MSSKRQQFIDEARVELVHKIAEGGMSVVYEGSLHGCEGFAKKVAVKMMLEKWSKDEWFMRQFIGEAKLVADLVHENIVQIYQLGQLKGGEYYIIMEYVYGVSLRDFLAYHTKNRLRIPEPLMVHILSRVARGLGYAHTFKDPEGVPLGIVHRDVCPNNILITTEGLTKLIDFGVAKAVAGMVMDDTWLTGKARYMSPEQAACKPVDFRSDIYSLGVVLFEMLSGKGIRPVTVSPQNEDFTKFPVPWDLLPADAGKELVGILKRMLQPYPEGRYQDTNQLARDMEYYIYKDGYGPTIQTIEAYLRQHFPDMYRREKIRPVLPPVEKTYTTHPS